MRQALLFYDWSVGVPPAKLAKQANSPRQFICIQTMDLDTNGKQKTSPDKFGWHDRGYIPHFDGEEVTQFITFRLADSMPQAVLERWKKESETDAVFRKSVEEYLDSGFGECYLAKHDIASMVQDALLHHAGSLYRLDAWCVMPNHGHVLLQPLPRVHLSDVMHSIKSFTAHEANKMLQRRGEFWQKEYFDRYIRNAKHYFAVIRYIENNPVKAGLCDFPWEWKHSSASYKRE